MLRRLPSRLHHAGVAVDALLHLVEHPFVLPAPYPTSICRRTLRLDRTRCAVRVPIGMYRHAVFNVRKPSRQSLSCRTAILVVARDVDEVGFAKPPIGP